LTEFRHSITSVPQLITDALQEIVSVQRISAFLQRPDIQHLGELQSNSNVAREDEPLVVVGDIAWSTPQEDSETTSAPFILRDLDITFPRGTFTLIAGKFGCGKSLLLNAILGEVALLRGRISYAVSPVADPWEAESPAEWGRCFEGLAFVPQVSGAVWPSVPSSPQDCMATESQYQVSRKRTPDCYNTHLRDNILFGLPMNTDRYRRVLYVRFLFVGTGPYSCQLRHVRSYLIWRCWKTET